MLVGREIVAQLQSDGVVDKWKEHLSDILQERRQEALVTATRVANSVLDNLNWGNIKTKHSIEVKVRQVLNMDPTILPVVNEAIKKKVTEFQPEMKETIHQMYIQQNEGEAGTTVGDSSAAAKPQTFDKVATGNGVVTQSPTRSVQSSPTHKPLLQAAGIKSELESKVKLEEALVPTQAAPTEIHWRVKYKQSLIEIFGDANMMSDDEEPPLKKAKK
eukprot:TRINITY_DN52874_c0_g1_i2.p1 TRINITY_DN52874_c0_g1~~TRINITY_DN52874_c0_g1_i2.p1  ORF type:complete len:240 (-),score=27.51 TRINITY_DN52874_c0_g1_i2:141-791(-)